LPANSYRQPVSTVVFDNNILLLMQIRVHGQNLESLYKEVPMRLLPVEYLPDDYKGPNAGTEKEIIGNNYNKIFVVTLGLSTISTHCDLLYEVHGSDFC